MKYTIEPKKQLHWPYPGNNLCRICITSDQKMNVFILDPDEYLYFEETGIKNLSALSVKFNTCDFNRVIGITTSMFHIVVQNTNKNSININLETFIKQ
jgi:hypothetical protein